MFVIYFKGPSTEDKSEAPNGERGEEPASTSAESDVNNPNAATDDKGQ